MMRVVLLLLIGMEVVKPRPPESGSKTMIRLLQKLPPEVSSASRGGCMAMIVALLMLVVLKPELLK
jgi:hypothetical protein